MGGKGRLQAGYDPSGSYGNGGAMSATTPSVDRQREQSRLEDLYQGIYPYLLQSEGVLQDVATRGKGMIPEVVNYVVQAGGKRLRPALVVLSAPLGGTHTDDAITVGAASRFIHFA